MSFIYSHLCLISTKSAAKLQKNPHNHPLRPIKVY